MELSLGEHTVVLTRALALLWCDIASVDFDPEVPHPSLAYQVAMEGVSYPKVFEVIGIGEDDLAVAGEIDIEIRRAVKIGRMYQVTSAIAGVERKVGGRVGPFERVSIVSEARSDGALDPDFTVNVSILVSRGVPAA
jgi:hypothetical protein